MVASMIYLFPELTVRQIPKWSLLNCSCTARSCPGSSLISRRQLARHLSCAAFRAASRTAIFWMCTSLSCHAYACAHPHWPSQVLSHFSDDELQCKSPALVQPATIPTVFIDPIPRPSTVQQVLLLAPRPINNAEAYKANCIT